MYFLYDRARSVSHNDKLHHPSAVIRNTSYLYLQGCCLGRQALQPDDKMIGSPERETEDVRDHDMDSHPHRLRQKQSEAYMFTYACK